MANLINLAKEKINELLLDACKRAVTAAVGIDDLGIHDRVILDVVDLELLGMAEVLENLSVFVSNCNSHGKKPSLGTRCSADDYTSFFHPLQVEGGKAKKDSAFAAESRG